MDARQPIGRISSPRPPVSRRFQAELAAVITVLCLLACWAMLVL